jgi:hypothetical protein
VKLIHGAIDFKVDGMNLGFNLLIEGKNSPTKLPLFITAVRLTFYKTL